MTDRSTRGPSAPATVAPRPGPARGANGWSRFAAVVMVVVGLFGVVQGLVALLGPVVYVRGGATVLIVGLAVWGWIHLVVGAVVALVGATLLSEDVGPLRLVAMGAVGVSALVQLVFLPAAPVWSVLLVALDVLILVALARAPERARP